MCFMNEKLIQALRWFAVVILILMLLLGNFPRQINPSVDSEFIYTPLNGTYI